MQERKRYGSFDLGFGVHVALDPDFYEALIPNIFVANNSLGKMLPPSCDNWDKEWDKCKLIARMLVDQLNRQEITEEQAQARIAEHNKYLETLRSK